MEKKMDHEMETGIMGCIESPLLLQERMGKSASGARRTGVR